ncbi:MAG TPA: adenylate/guanylate cyclase domain-containing protein [Candidatus Margulisiibacteriota bacterium]|nr:adenylate/guanylate cyclase domain-containing protein [Candidatus Margulisiibacteriota bacterium]
MIWQRLTPFRIALLLGFALSVLRFNGCHYLELIDVRAVDYRFLQRGVQPASPDVVIVAIDDASLERLGRWPWSRAVVAQLVNRLVAADAAVIGFDIVQSEATAQTDVELLRERVAGVDDRTWSAIRQALSSGATEDQKLVDAVQKSGRTVLGYFFDFSGQASDADVRVSTYNVVQNLGKAQGEARIPLAPMARMNLPALTDAGKEVGYFNFLPDADGSYRRVPLAIRFGSHIAVPLSLAMLRAYNAQNTLAVRIADFGVESVRVGSVSVPVAEDGEMLINYRGPGKTFRHVRAADVLDGTVPADTFRGKLVLVGVTATALADVRVTPFDGIFPGVEIHANLLDNILRRDFIVQPRWIVLVEIAVILASVLILGLVLHYARGLSGAAVAVLLIVAYLVGSQWLFVSFGMPLGLVYPLLAIGLTYSAIGVQHYVIEEGEKRKIRDAFGLYLSPHLARLVSERPEMLALGGEKRELTVLFSDIRGFTTMSEQLEPEALVELLNEYFGRMTDVIFSQDGTLDKYIGDAIMAVWGAPVPQSDHALRACRAALGMVNGLAKLVAEWRQRGLPELDIGIGINTGPMVVGNMGSARRLSYTVIGDNVNLGSRLEGLNKMYGSHIIASEATLQATRGALVARELDLVRVKGKRLPVRIFEILGTIDERERWRPLLHEFNAGLAAYREQRFDDAMFAFAAVLETHPDDGPTQLYIERCRDMLAAPPEPDWDGVTIMETK